MGKPITTKSAIYQSFGFPNVCLTPPTTPASPNGIPIPYPSIGIMGDASEASGENGKDPVRAGGDPVILRNSVIPNSSGDEPGTLGGIKSHVRGKEVRFTSSSSTVRVNGQGVVRLGDTTTQNMENCVGTVLGGLPTVRAGE